MATSRSKLFSREWPRPSVRNLLILVAAIGVCLGGIVEIRARRARFKQLAIDHYWQSGEYSFAIAGGEPGDTSFVDWHASITPAQRVYHSNLKEKYEFAADYPWLPVWPDGPAP